MTEPDLKDLWQSQETQEASMSIEQIRARATKFQRRVRLRNLIEYLAVPLVVAGYARIAWQAAEPMTQVGAAMVMLGALVIAWQLNRRAGARRTPAASAAALTEFHRAELIRQRDALSSVWLWYVGPVTPGLAVILASWWLHPSIPPGHDLAWVRTQWLIMLGVVAAVFATVLWLNTRGARRLQRQIEELDASRRGDLPS